MLTMKKHPLGTFVLLGLNVIIFAVLALGSKSLMMSSRYDVIAILNAGANLNPFTLGGQPWRIITSMFLHFGILHLLVNMFALYSMGRMLESELGTVRFLLVYFICGVASGLSSLFFNVYTISAGASGALFGLYGFRLGVELMGNLRNRRELNAVVVNFIVFVVINAFITSQFNVDLAGHIGGCVAGLLLSVLLEKAPMFGRSGNMAIVLAVLPLTMFILPRDQLYYYRIFQRVIKAEQYTNRLYRNNYTDNQIMDSLVTVVPEWEAIGNSIRTLKSVPAQLTADTANLSLYAKLRKDEALYRIALIGRESYVYLDSLGIVTKQFDALRPFDHILNFSLPEEANEEKEIPKDSANALLTKRIFFDAEWKEIDDPSAAAFYRIGVMDSLGRWQGPLQDFYRKGEIQMKGTYRDNMKNGVFLYYSDRGTYTSAGRYVNEDAVGKWENYHLNGALASEVYYDNGAFTRSVFDSLGKAQVINGNGKVTSWHTNGVVAEEGQYKNGRKEGDWYGFHGDGTPYFHELYRNNRLVHGASEDSEGKRYVYDQMSQYPFPVIGMKAYNEYIKKQVQRPGIPRDKSGTIKVIFNVGLDGAIWDFVVIESLTPAQDQEAINMIRTGPAWRPGVLHGHLKLPSQGYVEVTF